MPELHSSSPAELKERLAAERAGAPFLVYRDESGRQLVVALDAPVTVGRRPDNDIALPWDAEVSRVHAQLEPVGSDCSSSASESTTCHRTGSARASRRSP